MIPFPYDNPQYVERLIWRYGRPAELWLANGPFIAEFIEKERLAPVDNRHFWGEPISRDELLADDTASAVMIARKDFPGGKRTPHLHFMGEFYALDDEQWNRFSGAMVERFQAKLRDAHMVSFANLVELGEAIVTI